MKLALVFAALACSPGCASSDDRKEVATTSTEPSFSVHEGRPTAERTGATEPKGKGKSSGAEDDPWWSSAVGDLCGGMIGALFSKESDATPDVPNHGAPFTPWSLNP